MTIKGLWDQVHKASDGDAVDIARLSAECFYEKDRPLRVAVDTPLAIFEFKEATRVAEKHGGMNHTTRTFYYSVLHLFAAGVDPIFVFDGPQKPPEKGASHPAVITPCGHIATPPADGLPSTSRIRIAAASERTAMDITCERQLSHVIPLCRNILDQLGVPYRDAPGEAEAECAALEKAGIVDAVLTRDGDAFVFGSRVILQKLKADNKVARVHRYKMDDLQENGLRSHHLFLLAMMAGGDYDQGIPRCGPDNAMECARQNFGAQLEQYIKHHGSPQLDRWKTKLVAWLRSKNCNAIANNAESNAEFPSRTIADYYLKPAVTPLPELKNLQIDWAKPVSLPTLREWTREYFDWKHAHFAGKFVRTLAHPLLTRQLLAHGANGTDGSFLIMAITKSKVDGVEYLRVKFQPACVVDIDISGESINLAHRAKNMTEEVFDPSKEMLEWVPRWIVENGAPTAFQEWQSRNSTATAAKQKKRKAPLASAVDSDMPPKRPRGRPPKQAQAQTPTTITPPHLSVGNGNAKRPRGRPPKQAQTPRPTTNTPPRMSASDDSDHDSVDDFPDIKELAGRSAGRASRGHRPALTIATGPGSGHAEHDIVDLTSD